MAAGAASDNFAQVRGFKVEIDGADADLDWQAVSEGTVMIELTDTTIGSDKFTTTSPGHKSVNTVTLRGAMTGKRAALCQWINDTTSGRPWKRTLTITELLSRGSVGRQFVYHDCFPVRYVYPRLDLGGRSCPETVTEEVTLVYDSREVR